MGDEKVLKLYIASSDFINKLHVCKGPREFGNLLRWRQLKCGSKESELIRDHGNMEFTKVGVF